VRENGFERERELIRERDAEIRRRRRREEYGFSAEIKKEEAEVG
jgi:hypothetical protein